jgi:hypothetical protein
MANLLRTSKEGSSVNNIIDERLPIVTNGLVAHYPFDGNGGAIDVINGAGTIANVESNINILDCLAKSWRDPANWNMVCNWDETEQAMVFNNGNGGTALLEVYIPIITSKKYFIEADIKMGSSSSGILYFGTISYDINKSVQPGHPGTYDYFGSAGNAYSTTYQKFRNTAISNAPRTGETSDTNYSTWHTGTKFAKIMLLPNYSGTGTTYVKDLKFYTTDVDSSGAVITNNGIAIQEASTNIMTQPIASYSSWGDNTIATTTQVVSKNGTPEIVTNIIACDGGVRWYTISGWVPVSGSTQYMISCKMKTSFLPYVSPNLFYIREYNSSATQVTEYGIFSSANMVPYDEEYFFIWASFTTNASTAYINLEGYNYVAPCVISVYDFKIEQRAFSTEFNLGSKPIGKVQVPIPVEAQVFPFTMTVKIKNLLRGGQNGEGNEPTVGYPISWWGPGSGVLAQISRTNPYFQKPEFRLTLICHSTSFEIYFDNVLYGSAGYYANIVPPWTLPIDLGRRNEPGYPAFNGVYSDLSFYNRAITTTEMSLLIGEKMLSRPNYLQTSKLIEKPALPKDCWYFPLAHNTLSSNKIISASDATNVVYEDGSAWVGNATTNLLALSGYNNFNNVNGIYGNTIKKVINNNQAYYTVSSNPETLRTYCNLSDLSNGATYTSSIKVDNAYTMSLDWCDVGGSVSESKFISKITTSRSTYDGTYRFLDINLAMNSTYLLRDIQVEASVFRSPYVNGSRGVGSLEFNLNRDIGLDWSGDWSVCYWRKPIATNDGFTGYNIDSFGCNSNSVGGGYLWWGKTSGANLIALHGNNAGGFDPADYFGKWQFVSMIRSGSVVTMTTYYIGSQYYTFAASPGLAPNGFVTQYGYDLKLGGWDDTNVSNTYFRDLMVFKRAISVSELQYIRSVTSTNAFGMQTNNLIENNLT